nr:MAG TPA: hypothetical protein [Caudoviricetes sp.]
MAAFFFPAFWSWLKCAGTALGNDIHKKEPMVKPSAQET